METIIKAGGLFNIGLALFHLAFWRLFDWHDELKNISFVNRAVMQVLNISLTLVFLIFAYVSLLHTRALLSTPLGNSLLVLMALFWLARSVQQVVFFRLRHPLSWLFLLVFITGFALYATPVVTFLQPPG